MKNLRRVLVIVDDVDQVVRALSKAYKEINRFVFKRMDYWELGPFSVSEMYSAACGIYDSSADYDSMLKTESEVTEGLLEAYFKDKAVYKDGHYVRFTNVNPEVKLSGYHLTPHSEYSLPVSDTSRKVLNCLPKRALDMENIHGPARDEANQEYDEFEAFLEELWGHEPGPDYKELLSKNNNSSIKANAAYAEDIWRQKTMKKFDLQSDPVKHFFYDLGGRSAYVNKAVRRSFQTDAVLDSDGEWWERGMMTQDARILDPLDEEEWVDNFHRLLDGTPEDSWLVIINIFPLTLDEVFAGWAIEK